MTSEKVVLRSACWWMETSSLPRGPGTAIDFGLAMITALLGEETAKGVAEEIAL